MASNFLQMYKKYTSSAPPALPSLNSSKSGTGPSSQPHQEPTRSCGPYS